MKIRVNPTIFVYVLLSALMTISSSLVAIYAIARDASWASVPIVVALVSAVVTAGIPIARFIRVKLAKKGKDVDADFIFNRFEEVIKERKASIHELTEVLETLDPTVRKMKETAREAARRIEDLTKRVHKVVPSTRQCDVAEESIIKNLSEIYDELEAHDTVFKTISEVGSALRSQEA